MAASMTIVRATIARLNGHGFQTREDPGTWWNLSRFATPTPTIPPVGTEVLLTIDGSGFVRSIEPSTDSRNPTPAATGAPERGDGPRMARSCPSARGLRLACLAAAAAFLAPRAEAKSTDVLTLAERFEQWAVRAQGPTL